MHIICLTPVEEGVYNDHSAEWITMPKEGEAYIPEPGDPVPLEWAGKEIDYTKPSTFPRLGSIEAEELTYTREVEVEGTEGETVIEQREYTMMTVTAMTEGTLPEVIEEEPEPTAQEDTDAMMVDHEYRLTLLELGLFE